MRRTGGKEYWRKVSWLSSVRHIAGDRVSSLRAGACQQEPPLNDHSPAKTSWGAEKEWGDTKSNKRTQRTKFLRTKSCMVFLSAKGAAEKGSSAGPGQGKEQGWKEVVRAPEAAWLLGMMQEVHSADPSPPSCPPRLGPLTGRLPQLSSSTWRSSPLCTLASSWASEAGCQ